MGNNIDFGNLRGQNLADPKFSKDSVNLRTLTNAIAIVSGNTVSAVVSGITAGSNISITGSTSAITISLQNDISLTSVYASFISGGTLYSGSTPLSTIIQSFADGNDLTRVQAGTNITTGGTANNPIISTVSNPSFTSVYSTDLSGGTIYSGSTPLSNIIQLFIPADQNDITRIQPGNNITTGGTNNFPTVNLVANPFINNITISGTGLFNEFSGTSISGGTIYSGSTPLSNIIVNIATGITSTLQSGFSGLTASTGVHSIIANNNSGNRAGGNFSTIIGKSNSATTPYSSILGGAKNLASGNSFSSTYSSPTIVGGYRNTALGGAYNGSSFIGSGKHNFASGTYYTGSVIVGGKYNTATGDFSSIGGGESNLSSSYYTTVGGGQDNTASNQQSTVAGGSSNTASGSRAVVAGGSNNRAISTHASILGGSINNATGFRSSIVGGEYNRTSGTNSVVVGGTKNMASNTSAFIGGGGSNTASTIYSSIVGGILNTVSGNYSSIGSGKQNAVSGIYSSISNGYRNTVSDSGSFIGGGRLNTTSGSFSAILNGIGNIITSNFSGVISGSGNTTSALQSAIINGSGNTLTSGATNSVILGQSDFTGGEPDTVYFKHATGFTISANTFYSGSTPLSDILINLVSTISGGTGSIPADGRFVTLSGGTVSGGTFYSGATELGVIIQRFSDGNDITRVQPGRNISTGGTDNFPTINLVDSPFVTNISISGTGYFNILSGSSISASTISSGNTDLGIIIQRFISPDQNDITRVQPGTNIVTGGTDNFPVINLIDSPFINNLTSSGATSLNSLSASTYFSGSTDLGTIISRFLDGNDITRVQPGYGILTGGTNNFPIVSVNSNLSLVTLSGGTLSGGTFFSGSTDLGSIIQRFADGNDITRVQPGANITTGGTGNFPVVSLTSNIAVNNIFASGLTLANTFSANTVSGGTFYSGSTPLSTIIQSFISPDQNDITRVQPGTNISTGGTDNYPSVNLVPNPFVNNFNSSGLTSFNLLSGASVSASSFTYTDGNQSSGYVLTSDASGVATWQPHSDISVITFMFTSGISDSSNYLTMPSLSNYIENTISFTARTITTTPTILTSFITEPGYPNRTVFSDGIITAHYETEKAAGANNYYTYFEVYTRDISGTETLRATSDNTTQSASNARIQNTATATVNSATTISVTDRILIKVYGVMLSSSASISIYFDNGTESRLQLPTILADVTNFIPYTGATAGVNLNNKSLNNVSSFSATSVFGTTGSINTLYSSSAYTVFVSGGTGILSTNLGVGLSAATSATTLDVFGTFKTTTPTGALGGSITTAGDYVVHTFYSSGTFTPLISNLPVEYLMVGGGGAGGNGGTFGGNGGGGAGGFLTGSTTISVSAYTITVGSGGTSSTNGGSSVISAINTVIGGGKGGAYAGGNGSTGGSGGGGAGSTGAAGTGGAGTAGQGFSGGSGFSSATNPVGAGGGGAGTPGGNGVSTVLAGSGGTGVSSSINGTATFYAGGGGGARWNGVGTDGTGGSGGGGNGNGVSSGIGGAGTPNTGGGGGGGGSTGGAGGSGIVIVRYLKSYAVNSGSGMGLLSIYSDSAGLVTVPTLSSNTITNNTIHSVTNTSVSYSGTTGAFTTATGTTSNFTTARGTSSLFSATSGTTGSFNTLYSATGNIASISGTTVAAGTDITAGVGGAGTINRSVIINGGSTGLAYFGTQQNSVTKAIMGNSNGASALINGSVLGDLCLRNSQKILISADAGVTSNITIAATGEVTAGIFSASTLTALQTLTLTPVSVLPSAQAGRIFFSGGTFFCYTGTTGASIRKFTTVAP